MVSESIAHEAEIIVLVKSNQLVENFENKKNLAS